MQLMVELMADESLIPVCPPVASTVIRMVQSIFPSEEKFAQPNIFIFHRDTRGNLASGYTALVTNWWLPFWWLFNGTNFVVKL